MKLLANSKLLCALLAVVSVGMGVQTYYLVRVHRQLRASEVQAAETTAWIETSEADDDQTALIPADPRTSLVPVDPFADLDQAEERMRSLFDNFHDRFDRNFGDSWFDSYEVTVDVPGAEETEVVVRVEGDMLIVEGSCATSNEESEPGSFVRRERQFGRFERRLAIPQDADDSTLHTEYANGVSKVTLLKKS